MTTRSLQIECLLDPIIDPNTGDICSSGYTVYFYAAGTSTPKNVWTEKEKTNPFTSKSIGSDGTIQLYGDGIYKIVIKDSDGDTIHEWDDIKIEASNFLITTKTAAYTVTPDDDLVLVDTDGGNVTLSLQAVANFSYPVVIKNTGSNQVTIDPNGAETIDGAATITLSTGAHTTLYPNTSSGLWHRTVDVTVFEDADGDTKIEVEKTADDDVLRFYIGDKTLTAAAEIMTLQAIDTTACKLEPTTDVKLDIGSTSKKIRIAHINEFNMGTTAYQASFPTNPTISADAKIMLGLSSTIIWMYLNTAPPGWKVLTTGEDSVLGVKATAKSSGTADANNPSKLEDSGADFSGDGVVIGDTAYNTADGTSALVTGVDSGTVLSLASDVFPDGDETYEVGTKFVDPGGNQADAGSWTPTGVTAATENSHTHPMGTSGTVDPIDTTHSIITDGGFILGAIGGGAGPAKSKVTDPTAAGSAHTHTITDDGKWRPAASIGRLFQLDTA